MLDITFVLLQRRYLIVMGFKVSGNQRGVACGNSYCSLELQFRALTDIGFENSPLHYSLSVH